MEKRRREGGMKRYGDKERRRGNEEIWRKGEEKGGKRET